MPKYHFEVSYPSEYARNQLAVILLETLEDMNTVSMVNHTKFWVECSPQSAEDIENRLVALGCTVAVTKIGGQE